MHVVVAVEGWTGASAGTAHAAPLPRVVEEAWRAARPHVSVTAWDVPDAGPTTARTLADGDGTGREVVAGCVLVRRGQDRFLAPAQGSRWDPHAVREALEWLAEHDAHGDLVIPLGDADPAGDAAALWWDMAGDDASLAAAITALRERLRPLNMVALVGSPRPLLGFHGMSAAVRDGRESDAALAVAAQEQEDRWARRARVVDSLPAPRRMMLGPTHLADVPGSGAAGGLAFALAAVGATLRPGGPAVLDAVGVEAAARDAGLLVAVVPELTPRVLDHGLPHAIAALAGRIGVPAVVLAGAVHVGKRDLMAAGIAAAHEGGEAPDALADAVRRVAHTWTR